MKLLVIPIGKLTFLFKNKNIPSNPKTIAIIKIGAIGDVLMSTPLLENVRKAYPSARIIYVVGNWSKAVLEGNPAIDSLVPFDDQIIWDRHYLKIWNLAKEVRREKIDIGFILDRHYFASLFGFLCGIRFRIGFDRKGEGFANNLNVIYGPIRHEIEYSLDLLRALGKPAAYEGMKVFLAESDKHFANDFVREHNLQNAAVVGLMAGGAVNPGQSMLIRRWPTDHFIELTRLLLKSFPKIRILMFGGLGDKKINKGIIESTDENFVKNVAGKASIKQSIALMKHCRVFVTHDSGPMHMAAAAGIPVISIFGPVHPERKAPIGLRHTYVWKPDLPGALTDDEGKFPAGLSELECMRGVQPESILRLVKKVLG